MCVLTISGKAFLWHQIRCIVSVLFRVGAGKEMPDVVRQLLDIETNPRRPQYQMASEVPLNLFNVQYENNDNIVWNYDSTAQISLIRQLQTLWTEHSVKASMLRTVLNEVESIETAYNSDKTTLGTIPVFQAESLVANNYSRRKDYVPLMEMQSCPPFEDKLNSSAAKRRKNYCGTENSEQSDL